MYRNMLRIRRFEEEALRQYDIGRIRGTLHPCIGQEAVAVGVSILLTPQDLTVSTHRGHGHLLARGQNMGPLMAELFGKAHGLCGGRGGTQHLSNPDLGHIGSNGITGGGIPVATGLAMAKKMRGEPGRVVCYFGDGATNQGVLWESLNIACLHSLPIVYICEHNMYAMSTRTADSHCVPIDNLVSAYPISLYCTDGMNPWAVRSTINVLSTPAFVLAETYRFCGHSRSDRCAYRTRDEENAWRLRDPIEVHLHPNWQEIEDRVQLEVEEAVKYALR